MLLEYLLHIKFGKSYKCAKFDLCGKDLVALSGGEYKLSKHR